MSVLEECKRNFKVELRRFVGLHAIAANPADIQRQRGRLRQLLTDVRCGTVAMLSASPSSMPPASVDQKRRPGKDGEKRAAAAAAASRLNVTASVSESASSTQMHAATTLPSSTAGTITRERGAGSPANRRDPAVDLKVAEVFAEECLAAAQYLLARGLYEDVVNVCLDPLEKDVQQVLRGVAANLETERLVERANAAAAFAGARDFYLEDEDEGSQMQASVDKTMRPFGLAKSPKIPKEMLHPWRLLAQYDLLRYICQFYTAFLHTNKRLDFLSEALPLAKEHLASLTSRLIVIAEVDADDSYHILFNGTLTVYEMCLYMMRQAREHVNETIECVIRHVAICLDICESSTLKLATVRYMPWRIRLYDYLAACYEQRGMYSEALSVVQRATSKIQELINLEFLDPVPPPQSMQDIMLQSLSHISLSVMRYTWYANSTNTTAGGKATTTTTAADGPQSSKQQSAPPQALSSAAQQELIMNEMPSNGNELLDRAWQLLLKVELPKRPGPNTPNANSAETAPGKDGKGKAQSKQQQQKQKQKKDQQQQLQEVVNKDLVAQRIWGPLMRFLLSIATASSLPAGAGGIATTTTTGGGSGYGHSHHHTSSGDASSPLPPSQIKQFALWGLEALEFLARYATASYTKVNPDVKQQGLPEEFADVNMLSPRQDQQQASSNNNNAASANAGRKRNSLPRRGNRAQPSAVPVTIPATADEAFLSSITLEHLLYNLAQPSVSQPNVPEDAENSVSVKQHHAESISEECLLFTLILHRVLYTCKDIKLYGRLCTCSISSLLQRYGEDEDETRHHGGNQYRKTSNKKIMGPPPKKVIQLKLLDTVCAALRLLQRLSRMSAHQMIRVSDLVSVAQGLEELSELYAGPNTGSVMAILQQCKKDTTITMMPSSTLPSSSSSSPRLGTSTLLSNSFAATCQGLLEETATILEQHAGSFSPSYLASNSFLTLTSTNNASTAKNSDTTVHGKKEKNETMGEEEEEEEWEIEDMYHRIVCSYLGAKVNSGLSDGVSIGNLVISYVKEIEFQISVSSNSSNSGDGGGGGGDNLMEASSSLLNPSMGKENRDPNRRFHVLDGSMRTLRKKCYKARIGLAAIRMAVGCLAVHSSSSPADRLSTEQSSKRNGTQINKVRKGLQNRETTRIHEEKEEKDGEDGGGGGVRREKDGVESKEEELKRIRRDLEIRDMRTELMRWMVKLRWAAAILRQHYAALEKHKSDIKLVMERQANTKVYGATTMKEANILESLLHAQPEVPRVCDDEKGRLLAWSIDEGDELLQALVLMCLAPHQLQTKTQREMLEGAFYFLQRHENHRRGQGHHTSPMAYTVNQAGESAYSALMIWCYAISTCGKLGFNNMTESAKDVLYAAFARRSDTEDDEVTAKEEQKTPATTVTGINNNNNNNNNNNTNSKRMGATPYDSTGEPPFMFLVRANEEVLAVSSALQLQTLVSALLWLSTVEARRIPYHNFDTTGLMPFSGKSVMLEVPFQQRYGVTRVQLWHMRSAYRIQFAMELAGRVKDSSLMLQCSFELFNTLLPSLTDENYYPFLLPPLATLCEALLQQKGSTWSDAHVQRLAARTLDALLKTVSKMSTSGTEVEYNLQNTINNNNNNNNNNTVESSSNEKSNVVPTSIQGWYELLIRLFVHVWENVYNYPNPRQVRYKENVRRGATAVQRLLSLGGGEGGRGGMDESGAYGNMNSTPRFSGIKGNITPTPAGATPAVGSNMASMFPGGGYAVPDTILDDCVPIEFLELLGAILFTVPGGMALLAPTSPSKGEKSTSENNNNPQSTMAGGGCGKALVGVPAWLFSVANALKSKNPTAAFDRLQQASDDPLYAKTAVYIVEYLLREGDMASARRVATDALQGIDKVHQSVQAHWHAVMENITDWLEREGFMLVAPSRPNRKTVEEEQPNLKGKGRKGKSIVKETVEPLPLQEKKTTNNFASNGDIQWSSAEEQMLRQLTRSYAFVRRRQALAWLRKRILQFNAPYRAQLHFYLSIIAQAFLEHRRQQQHESRIDEIMGANGVSTRAAGAGGGGGQKTKTRGGGDDAAAAAAMRAEELKAEEREQEESFIQHAVRSAILFNRCRFPSRAFATISQAIDGLRRLVCEEPPDLTMKDELLLLGNSNSRDMYSPGDDHGLRAREGHGVSSDSLASTSRDCNSDVTRIMAVNEKLIGWGPKVLPLARALEEMLLLLWKGFVDYRRDVDFLQPAAVKVGQDVNLEEQLHFQGRIPSLYSYTSSAGQYEEKRLMHLSAWKSACLMRSFEWRTRDMQTAEQKGRDDIHLQWLTDLRTLLTDCVSAGVLTLGNSCLSDLEQEITNVAERNTRRLTTSQSPTMPAKTKKKSPGTIVRMQQGVIPEPIRTDSIDATQLIALRFGSTIPAEKVIAAFMFLLRYMQFNCQLASLELSIEVHKLTGGFFAYALLPFTLSMQRTIGEAPDDELFNEYIKLHQNEPMQKVLVRNAKRSWENYTTTEMYQRVIYRLGRTLLPSKPNDKEAVSIIESSLIDNSTETLAKTSLDTTAVGGYGSSPRQVILRNGMRQQQITLRDVISSFETATAYLQERHLFGQLAEQLYELGRIHLLHRQRSEAERSWIEAVDAALEVPDSLRRPAETWKELNVAVIGLPRLLLAIMSLSSLAMYIYREQQGKAVDAYLLASRILEHFFKQGTTSNFPQRLRDFGGFMLEDLIVLPQLGDTMPTLMPQVVHHMLFLAWELLRFKFPFYAAMVASFTEYLARTYMRHVASTVEARLVQAMAASKFGSYKASMKILRDVCQGVRIPRGAMDGSALCLRPLLECADTAKTMAGTAAATGGGKNIKRGGDNRGSSPYRQTDTQADQQQQYELLEGLYEDSELPVTPGNIASVQTFLTQCFSAGSVSTTASNLPPQHASPSSHAAAAAASSLGSGGNSLLRESLAACYGSHLSRRVELTVADFLVTLGSKEAAYVWCASSIPSPQQQQQQLRPVSSDRRSGRSRSLQRVTLQSFSGSACIEALNAAEQILQYLLIRVQDNNDNKGGNATHTTGDTNRKRSPGRERSNPTTTLPANSQTKRDREVEDVYIRCTAELLLARILTAKGESSKALTILRNLVKNFNERMECNTIIPAVTGAPSYLWTVGTQIFWCDVYELMVLNHVRIREYIAAKQVISDALALCERCGDARSGRVFSLYDAAITARSGNTTKATETLSLLQKVSHSLRSDNRMDMFYAWTVIAAKSLKRVAKWYGGGGGREHREISFSSSPTQPQVPHSSSSLSSLSSVETLELAARELQGYCEMYGLLPGCVPFLETKRLSTTSTTTNTLAAAAAAASTSQRWLLVAWNVEAIFLHTALNLLAEEYIRLGKLELAEGVLEHIISVVAPQYDTSAHPTLLIESQFRLARVLCLLKPQLITEQRKSDDQAKEVASEQQESSTDDLLNKLDAPRKKPIQLLMDVVENIVTRGTHDYNILRLALLYLSILLSRAERSFHIMASTCLILAKFVVDMNFHVFSGTSIFSLYGEENIQLGIDLVLSESITAVIQSTQRSLGNISEKDVATATTIASTAATTTSGGGSGKSAAIEARRPSSRSRDDANLKSGLVTLPNIVSAFASLHLERSLQYVFPPLESLDLETALQHIRAYLQTKTAPLTGYYLWYDELTRETVIRQQQQPQQHSPGYGRLGETMRAQRSSLVTADATGATLSLLPPIVVDKLPPLLSASTLAQLGIPKVNTVICQSFVCDVNNGSISGKSTKQHAAAQHRPGGGNKKQRALTSSTATRSTQRATNTLITTTTTTTTTNNNNNNNNNNSSPSSVMNTSGMMTFVLFVSPVHDPTVTQPPPLNEKTQPTQNKKSYRAGLKNTVSSMDAKSLSVSTFSSHPWSGTCCVMFELPVEELQTLLEEAVQTLQMMQTPSTTVVVSSGADNEEQQEVPIEAVLGQRLSEAMVLLTAKAAPPSSSKKSPRSAANTEVVLSSTLSQSANTALSARQGPFSSAQTENVTAALFPTDISATDAAAGVVPAVDEAKSKLVTNFIELIVRSVVPRAVTDDDLMEHCVQSLFPRCAVTVEVVRFLRSMAANDDGGAISLFHPGLHEWFLRVAKFVMEYS